jgi:hypothetical protein
VSDANRAAAREIAEWFGSSWLEAGDTDEIAAILDRHRNHVELLEAQVYVTQEWRRQAEAARGRIAELELVNLKLEADNARLKAELNERRKKADKGYDAALRAALDEGEK